MKQQFEDVLVDKADVSARFSSCDSVVEWLLHQILALSEPYT